MLRPLPSEQKAVLIAAVCGRVLAASARRAGIVPLVADFFADADTAAMAHACHRVDGDLRGGFRREALQEGLDRLVALAPAPIVGIVYGSGFEDRPRLIAQLAEVWPVLGNDAESVARIKAPETFFPLLDRLGVAHPATVLRHAEAEPGWLAKRIGGAGGSHVGRAGAQSSGADVYYQEPLAGRSVSTAFVANGARAFTLGFSEQWTAPTVRSAWRFGGAVAPAELETSTVETMIDAVNRASHAFGLKGLGSADFIVTAQGPQLLEVNPRPGATLDLFDRGRTPLFQLHLEAVMHGRLPEAAPLLEGASAAATVFADAPLTVPPAVNWPDWVVDRPHGGERIDKDSPICTVLAQAGTADAARRLAEARRDKAAFNVLTATAA